MTNVLVHLNPYASKVVADAGLRKGWYVLTDIRRNGKEILFVVKFNGITYKFYCDDIDRMMTRDSHAEWLREYKERGKRHWIGLGIVFSIMILGMVLIYVL